MTGWIPKWLFLALLALATTAFAETKIVKCTAEDGREYFANQCDGASVIEDVELGNTTRLNPAPASPVQGFMDYYNRYYLLLRIKLRELGILD